jgi:signal-transduction protein with cAMP-binding, CBS, and nucleotidyltransferase domain
MSIEHLVSKPVSTLPPSASCAEAARRMRRQNMGSVVIEEDGVPIGIVTDRDLALRVVAEELQPGDVPVGSIMSKFPAFLSSDRDLTEAVATMREMCVRRLPVIGAHGRVIGMLALDDVLIALADEMGQVRELLRAESSRVEADDQVAI